MMAVSPLIPPPASAPAPVPPQTDTGPTLSPLKRQLSAISSSANGTPIPSKGAKAKPVGGGALGAMAGGSGSGPMPDLLEQMNQAEADKYVTTKFLGEGTYAIVHQGYERANPSNVVAIKMIKVQKDTEGMAPDAVRELKHLMELSHPNIIALQAVFSANGQNLCLVLEYLPLGDLEMLIRDAAGVIYSGADIKAWMGMLGRAVWFCHESFVLHRDIKPNNLLIAADGEVKLADFGLARSFSDPYRPMTHNVITRWYRPPELLFGARFYSGAVDIWSVGCVFAELVLRRPFLPGNTELEQLSLIGRELGDPTEENWPGVSTLDSYTPPSSVDAAHPIPSREKMTATFGIVGPDGVDLLMRTLTLDPRRRVTAREMLQHPWWRSAPRPTRKENLPRKRPYGGGAGAAESRIGADLKRRPGEVDDSSAAENTPALGSSGVSGGRAVKVARKLDFGAMKK